MRIGCLNPKRQIPRLSMRTMQSLKDEDMYFVCLEILCSRLAATCQVNVGNSFWLESPLVSFYQRLLYNFSPFFFSIDESTARHCPLYARRGLHR